MIIDVQLSIADMDLVDDEDARAEISFVVSGLHQDASTGTPCLVPATESSILQC
jgi:hypothetical protein